MANWDIVGLIQTANAFARAVLPLLGALSAVMGLYMMGRAIRTMFKTDREEGAVNWASIGGQAVVAAMLLRLGGTADWARELIGDTGTGFRDYLQMGAGGANDGMVLKQIVAVGLLWVAVIGFVGIVRGLHLWGEASAGNSQAGKSAFWGGLWHILGGAVAINVGL